MPAKKRLPLSASPSQLRQSALQFLIRQLAALRLGHQILSRCHSGIPFTCADLAPLLPGLQTVVGPVVFLRRWGSVLLALRLRAVRSDLPAGAFGLAWGNVVAAAGVISCRQQEVPPTVVTAARFLLRVPGNTRSEENPSGC